MKCENINNQYCTGCDKHCAANALQCGKGRRLFGIEREEHEPYQHQNRDGYRGHDKHHGHEEQGGYGKHHEDGSHHEKHRGKEAPWWEGRDELSALLGKCGHYLFKRPGKGRGQGQILRILAERKSISQRELQAALDIKPGSISEILTKLESKGFILREKSEEDKRAAVVRITEAGEAALAEKNEKEEPRDLFVCLSAEEKDSLRAILGKLLDDWYGKDPSDTEK